MTTRNKETGKMSSCKHEWVFVRYGHNKSGKQTTVERCSKCSKHREMSDAQWQALQKAHAAVRARAAKARKEAFEAMERDSLSGEAWVAERADKAMKRFWAGTMTGKEVVLWAKRQQEWEAINEPREEEPAEAKPVTKPDPQANWPEGGYCGRCPVATRCCDYCSQEEDDRDALCAEWDKKLGSNQKAILGSLRCHGSWKAGCGWVWDTHSGTVRLLDSVVKHGLASVTMEPRHRGGRTYQRPVYRLTELGERVEKVVKW